MPSLITNHRKAVVEARLQKFNSMMMQAIIESEKDNGMYEDWPIANNGTNKPFEFFNNYLKPYIKTGEVEQINEGLTKVYLTDGSSFLISRGGCYDFIYDINSDQIPNAYGKDQFVFLICPTGTHTDLCINSKWCSYGSTSGRATALQPCKESAYRCSRLLELEEWKIPNDYPYHI